MVSEALFAGRNLEESGGICESVNSEFQLSTVNSGWYSYQPNGPLVAKSESKFRGERGQISIEMSFTLQLRL